MKGYAMKQWAVVKIVNRASEKKIKRKQALRPKLARR